MWRMSGRHTLESLAAEAIALGENSPRAILGIAGSPAAGKSTLAAEVLGRINERCGAGWAAHVPMDGFHLADDQLRRLGLLDRKGAPETFDPAGYAHLLERVRTETEADVYVPGFDRVLEQPIAGALVVQPAAQLVITEGNYLLLDDPPWLRVRRATDRVWFVAAVEELRIARLTARHVEFGKTASQAQAWVAEVDDRNALRVGPTEAAADRVIVNGASGWAVVQ